MDEIAIKKMLTLYPKVRFLWAHGDVQLWLAQLPRDVAAAIAWKNGERLFPAAP